MSNADSDKIYLIDTNVILRFLLNDHDTYGPKATAFMKDVSAGSLKAEIMECVMLECIYVLEKFYEIPRQEIADRLSRILNFQGIINSNKAILLKALFHYQKMTVDFADCLLASYSAKDKVVVSFDKDFKKLNAIWIKI